MTEGTEALHSPLALPSTLSRNWNRLLSSIRARKLRVVYSPLYRIDLGTTPVDVLRAERILAFLLGYGLLSPKRLMRPEVASLWDLRLAHGRGYLESLRRPESLNEIIGVEAWPDLHRQALLAQRAAVGGTVLATTHALETTGTVFNLGGGFHHAGRLQGRGFCIFNDVAVAIGRARRDGFTGRVLVIDLDLHDGNGTREIFGEDSTVFTFSVHNQTWDLTPAEASLSVELGADVDDATYLPVLDREIPRLLEEIEPELVYFLAGTDPAADDRIGNWRISESGMLRRDQRVMSCLSHWRDNHPTVIVLAGGYGSHTWRYTARFLSWLTLGHARVEPPSTAEITLARYRHLSQDLRPQIQGTPTMEENDWGLTEADVMGEIGDQARHSLFLDHYSHHAVELALEWTGIFDRLRQMGFAHPTVDLDLENLAGDTLRIYADSQLEELLVELRLTRDRHSVAGLEVLNIEWLLLQNPRAVFTRDQPQLPGQKHPGLGMVRDIISLLILISDRLQLDGILFVPSQYHLAVQARRVLRFLYPTDEGWFRALYSALDSVPIDEAADLIANSQVLDANTNRPVSWRPMQMVFPISDQLHDRVEGTDYEAEAVAAASLAEFRIVTAAQTMNDRPNPAEPG